MLSRAISLFIARVGRSWLPVALFGQILKTNGAVVFHIVRVNESLAVAVPVQVDAGGTPTVRLTAATKLHRPASLETRNTICRHSIFVIFGVDQVVSVRIVSREVKEVNAGEDDEESTQKGNGIDSVRGIESLEQNERGAKRSGRKSDIVERVDTAKEEIAD